jgi:hypothetical protein
VVVSLSSPVSLSPGGGWMSGGVSLLSCLPVPRRRVDEWWSYN